AEAETPEGARHGGRLTPDGLRRILPAGQRQGRRNRPEDRLQAIDSAALLIEGDKRGDPQDPTDRVVQRPYLEGVLNVPGEQDDGAGPDPLQKRPEGRLEGRAP